MVMPDPPDPGPSRRAQVWSGIGLGVLSWVTAGVLLAFTQNPAALGMVFVGWLVLVIAIGRQPGRSAMVLSLVITSIVVPVLLVLAAIGMCAGMLRV